MSDKPLAKAALTAILAAGALSPSARAQQTPPQAQTQQAQPPAQTVFQSEDPALQALFDDAAKVIAEKPKMLFHSQAAWAGNKFPVGKHDKEVNEALKKVLDATIAANPKATGSIINLPKGTDHVFVVNVDQKSVVVFPGAFKKESGVIVFNPTGVGIPTDPGIPPGMDPNVKAFSEGSISPQTLVISAATAIDDNNRRLDPAAFKGMQR